MIFAKESAALIMSAFAKLMKLTAKAPHIGGGQRRAFDREQKLKAWQAEFYKDATGPAGIGRQVRRALMRKEARGIESQARNGPNHTRLPRQDWRPVFREIVANS